MGLGEDLRSFAAMLEYLQIPFSVTDVPTDAQGKVQVAWKYMTTDDYDTSIFFMAATECQKLASQYPRLFSQPKKKIGYFLWELPDFPPEQVPALQLVDHIWCPTRFVQQSFFSKSKQLTLALPLPVVQHPGSGHDFRKNLGIAPSSFVCLYMFDLHSTLKRKNPQGVLRVFEKFANAQTDSCLVLKVNRWQQMGPDALNWIPQHPRIKIIKDTLTPGQLADLYKDANCYLSLHRSEGFGRTLVEALQHGLHVVSTNFSGPKDFLDSDNTLLVKWTKASVDPDDYPNLTVNSWWAEPDETHALEQLQNAYERAKLGANSSGIKTGQQFSHKALAQRYRPVLQSYLR